MGRRDRAGGTQVTAFRPMRPFPFSACRGRGQEARRGKRRPASDGRSEADRARRRDETREVSVEMPRRAKRRRTGCGARQGMESRTGRFRPCSPSAEHGLRPAGTCGSRHAAVHSLLSREEIISCPHGGKRQRSSGTGAWCRRKPQLPQRKGGHRTTMRRSADRTARPRSRRKTGRKARAERTVRVSASGRKPA